MHLASLLVFFSGPGLVLLLGILLFFFGGSKLPGLARGLKNFGANFRLGRKGETQSETQKKIDNRKS